MVLVLHLFIFCDYSSLLFLFSLFLVFSLHNIHTFHARLFFFCYFFKIKKKIKNKKKEKEGKMCFALILLDLKSRLAILSLHNMLCTLFSLDELILLHLDCFSFVMHVVWELFIIFDYMILILKSHVFYCND